MIPDWCEFYKDIEADPKAIVPRMTVGEFYEAREHIKLCSTCFDIVERVANSAPPATPDSLMGEN